MRHNQWLFMAYGIDSYQEEEVMGWFSDECVYVLYCLELVTDHITKLYVHILACFSIHQKLGSMRRQFKLRDL